VIEFVGAEIKVIDLGSVRLNGNKIQMSAIVERR
jgi:hypothetical protein